MGWALKERWIFSKSPKPMLALRAAAGSVPGSRGACPGCSVRWEEEHLLSDGLISRLGVGASFTEERGGGTAHRRHCPRAVGGEGLNPKRRARRNTQMLFAAFFFLFFSILLFASVMLQRYPAYRGPRASTLVHWAPLKLWPWSKYQ